MIDKILIYYRSGEDREYDRTIDIQIYVDADQAGCKKIRRLTTSYVILLNDTAISYCSKKQRTVAVSSTEAEYMAAGAAAREAMWVLMMLGSMARTFDIKAPQNIEMFIDN